MSKNLITPDKYVRITDKTYFVGDENTRFFHDEFLLCRDSIHPDEVAKLREKHPNLTAIHCMVSKTFPNGWRNPKLDKRVLYPVFNYNLDDLSVNLGVYQWVRAELCNKYFTPWYFSAMCPDDSCYKICYAINSLGDNCIWTAKVDREFDIMLKYLDGDPKLVKGKISRWINCIKARQSAFIKQSQTKHK